MFLGERHRGIGMNAAQQQRLFKPFEQAGADTSRLYGGTGLGLAICKRLAELMGGNIAMSSVPDVGTVMKLTLTVPISEVAPVDKDRRQAARRATVGMFPAPEPSLSPATAASGYRVLAVDDHPTNRLLLARQLEILGMDVKLAADGREALGVWQAEKFDLIITDCNMPEMDGYALARTVRAIEATAPQRPRIPILAWTANALPNVMDLCRDAGMDDLLTKPSDLEKVKTILEKWLPQTKIDLPEINKGADSSITGGNNSQKGLNMEADNEAEVVLNHQILIDALGGNEKIATDLLIKFRDSLPARILKLETALSTGNLDAAKSTSHQLKGAASTMGAAPLSHICEQIELAASAGDPAPLPALHTAFSGAAAKLAAELAKL